MARRPRGRGGKAPAEAAEEAPPEGFDPTTGVFGEVRDGPHIQPRELHEFHPDAGYTVRQALDHNVQQALARTLPVARYIRREDFYNNKMRDDMEERVADSTTRRMKQHLKLMYWPLEVGDVPIITRGKLEARYRPVQDANDPNKTLWVRWTSVAVQQGPESMKFFNLMVSIPELFDEMAKSLTTLTSLSQTCKLAFDTIEGRLTHWDYTLGEFPKGSKVFVCNPRVYRTDLRHRLHPEELSLSPTPHDQRLKKANPYDDANGHQFDPANVLAREAQTISNDIKLFGKRTWQWFSKFSKEEGTNTYLDPTAGGRDSDLGLFPMGILQQLPSTRFDRLKELFLAVHKSGSCLRVLHLSGLDWLDIRGVVMIVKALPKLEALTIVGCPLIHIGCVPRLLDIVDEHIRQAKLIGFHLDIFPDFQKGPANVMRRATYGVAFNKQESTPVLGGVLVLLLKSFLKSLQMKLDTPLLAKHSLLFKWMFKVPAPDDFWAKFVTYLRAYETFYQNGDEKQRNTLCYDILATMVDPDGRRAEKWYVGHSPMAWMQTKACEACECHMPNVCFPGMPKKEYDEDDQLINMTCMGCALHQTLDQFYMWDGTVTDHFRPQIMQTLHLLYGTRTIESKAVAQEKSQIDSLPHGLVRAQKEAAYDAYLKRHRDSEFPDVGVSFGENNGLMRPFSQAEKEQRRGLHDGRGERCGHPQQDNTSHLPTLEQLLSTTAADPESEDLAARVDWNMRWVRARAPKVSLSQTSREDVFSHGQPVDAQVTFDYFPCNGRHKWKSCLPVGGVVYLDFALLQMQTVPHNLWRPFRSLYEHEQDRGGIHTGGKADIVTRKNQLSYRQLAIILRDKLQVSFDKATGGNSKREREMADFWCGAPKQGRHVDRGVEFIVDTGTNPVHNEIVKLASWHAHNGKPIDGCYVQSQRWLNPAKSTLNDAGLSDASASSNGRRDSSPNTTTTASTSSSPERQGTGLTHLDPKPGGTSQTLGTRNNPAATLALPSRSRPKEYLRPTHDAWGPWDTTWPPASAASSTTITTTTKRPQQSGQGILPSQASPQPQQNERTTASASQTSLPPHLRGRTNATGPSQQCPQQNGRTIPTESPASQGIQQRGQTTVSASQTSLPPHLRGRTTVTEPSQQSGQATLPPHLRRRATATAITASQGVQQSGQTTVPASQTSLPPHLRGRTTATEPSQQSGQATLPPQTSVPPHLRGRTTATEPSQPRPKQNDNTTRAMPASQGPQQNFGNAWAASSAQNSRREGKYMLAEPKLQRPPNNGQATGGLGASRHAPPNGRSATATPNQQRLHQTGNPSRNSGAIPGSSTAGNSYASIASRAPPTTSGKNNRTSRPGYTIKQAKLSHKKAAPGSRW